MTTGRIVDEREPETRSRGTVLLVDDEPVIVHLGQVVLTHLGFEVLTAANGLEALTIYSSRREKLRLAILDLTMPVLDGYEAYHSIRSQDAAMPILLWTGQGEIDRLPEMSRVTRLLMKPFTIADLTSTILALTEQAVV